MIHDVFLPRAASYNYLLSSTTRRIVRGQSCVFVEFVYPADQTKYHFSCYNFFTRPKISSANSMLLRMWTLYTREGVVSRPAT